MPLDDDKQECQQAEVSFHPMFGFEQNEPEQSQIVIIPSNSGKNAKIIIKGRIFLRIQHANSK